MNVENNLLAKQDEKIENFKGITFINTYSEETNTLTIKRFKRDVLDILRNLTPKK